MLDFSNRTIAEYQPGDAVATQHNASFRWLDTHSQTLEPGTLAGLTGSHPEQFVTSLMRELVLAESWQHDGGSCH